MIKYPLRAGGVFTRVWDAGQSDGAVVLVHEVGLRLDWWRSNVSELADGGTRTLCMDLPGHGFADKFVETRLEIADQARFLGAFLDEAQLDRTVLVGSGMGGHIAARLACDAPRRVSGLVLSSPTGIVPIGRAARTALRRSLDDISREGAHQRALSMVSDPSLITPDWVEDEFRINASPGAREAFDSLSHYLDVQLDLETLGPELASLGIPTLLVWGAQDQVVPPSLLEQVKLCLPGASARVIEGGGHAPYFDRPAAFNAAVLDFLHHYA